MPTTYLDRLATLPPLARGAHRPGEGAYCAMEAAAWLAGEPHTDHPECVCPVIGSFVREWNDALPDDERETLLRPLVPLLVGTRDPALKQRRALMAADWLVREHAPAWLRLAGLTAHAEALASLPEITAMAQVPGIRPAIEAARRDAAAARDAAWDAARAAAGAAARDAARDAAWDAASATASAAAGAAARDAAWTTAREAARAALAPTRREMQQSALRLAHRMIAAGREG